MAATEEVVIVVAKRMIWPPVAETAQAHEMQAKMMTGMPATETVPVNVLQQSLGAAPAIAVEQRLGYAGRGRRGDDRCAGSRRVQGERTDDAVQQTAAHPRARSHGSPQG